MKSDPPTDLVIRPVAQDDLEPLMELLCTVPDSITSLQPDRDYLQKRIDQSLRSFYPVIHEPGLEHYFFVLEDPTAKRLAGTCSLYARTGGFEPSYTYEIVEEEYSYSPLDIRTKIPELKLRLDHKGPSELGGLFLHPDYRGSGMGGALSRCRFLFAKLFPERFTREIITEFRGVVTENGESPFWEAIGRHFFVHDFFTLDQYSAVARKDFIHALMPRHPIYIPLLPQSAIDVIGRAHSAARGAVHVLESEGFRYLERVDIFDAGPLYGAVQEKTQSHRLSCCVSLAETADKIESEPVLVANSSLDFRAMLCPLQVCEDGSGIILTKRHSTLLGVDPGDEVIYLPQQ